jgi:chromosome segregation ATPase
MWNSDEMAPWEELQAYYARVDDLETTQVELVRALKNHQVNIQSLIHEVQRLQETNKRLANDNKALKRYVTTQFRQPQNPGK